MRLLAQLSESNGTNSKPMLFYALITLLEHLHRLCSLLNYQSLLLTQKKKKGQQQQLYKTTAQESRHQLLCVLCKNTSVYDTFLFLRTK